MSEPQRLPHAFPFKFISREGGGAMVVFAPSAGDAFSRGGPVPPWVILEALTQGGGLAAAQGEEGGGALVQVSAYRCPRRVWPGDVLQIRGEVLKRMGPLLRLRVSARREGWLVARGVMVLRMGGG